jgi:hypothetical protein
MPIMWHMVTGRFPRQAVRKLERCEVFPLLALEGVGELRRFIDEVEAESIDRAKALGATAEDIASHMGITRQGAHYKLKFSEQRLQRIRARGSEPGRTGSPAPEEAGAAPGQETSPDQGSSTPGDGVDAGPR